MNTVLPQYDLLFAIAVPSTLLLIILILWIVLRRRIVEIQLEQERHRDQLDVLENKMSRIEGALFFGPSATWTMENRREARDRSDPGDPRITKGL